MARLGDVSFFIIDESHNYEKNITDHPIEDGRSVSDHAERQPTTFDVTGEVAGENAPETHLALIRQWRESEPATYVGRGKLTTAVIESLNTSRDANIAGGFYFTMTLKQVRIARTSTVDLLSPPVRAQVKDVDDAGRVQVS